MSTRLRFQSLILGIVAVHGAAWGQPCYSWSRAFTGPDFSEAPACSIVFDDGSGPKLFVGGQFQQAGGLAARGVARLDPTGWNNLGGGYGPVAGSTGVYAFAAFDADGAGPGPAALYAGGLFETMSGTSVRGVAKWNGSSWEAAGSGIFGGNVASLVVHDDGTGLRLYAGGSVQLSSGGNPYGLVKLEGGAWRSVPEWNGGVQVLSMASHDDGTGPALYAHVSQGEVHRVQGGVCMNTGAVFNPGVDSCLATYTDGNGTRLYLGSRVSRGIAVAVWDGTIWTPFVGDETWNLKGVRNFTVWDDGSGSSLYVLGDINDGTDPNMSGIVKYRNGQWSPLGTGVSGTSVATTAQVVNDGVNENLFVMGRFTNAGGIASRYSALWTGAQWLGRGRSTAGSGVASTTWDDGVGELTYAGTSATTGTGSLSVWDGAVWTAIPGGVSARINALAGVTGGTSPGVYGVGPFGWILDSGGNPAVSAPGIARWDGFGWSGVGGLYYGEGSSGRANGICAADLGDGPALYVGGEFHGVGGMQSANSGEVSGGVWTALGSGTNTTIHAMVRLDDGSGPATYAAGLFSQAGGQPAAKIAKWTGSEWLAVGGGFNDRVIALAVHDDGTGAKLYAGGQFTTADGLPVTGIAVWDGSAWSGLPGLLGANIQSLMSYDDGSGPRLYAGGAIVDTSSNVSQVAMWNGTAWTLVGANMGGLGRALAIYDDGSGETIYVAGSMTSGSAQGSVGGVAKLVNGAWHRVGGLSSVFNGGWNAMCVYDDGSGAKLYVGGEINGIPLLGGVRNALIRWDGASWVIPGGGVPDSFAVRPSVRALRVHDGKLMVCGQFVKTGGCNAMGVAAWNGSAWTEMLGVGGAVNAVTSDVVGGTPKLWFGGAYFVGGLTPAPYVARYKDGAWEPLGGGVSDNVFSIAAHDDGSGLAVYAGGYLTAAGGVSVSHIARWDGSAWSSLGSGTDNTVTSLASYGSALIAGGWFQNAGGLAAKHAAAWDGSAWSELGGGLVGQSGGPYTPGVYSMAVMDEGSGPSLFATGEFTIAGGSPASRIARWDGTAWSALSGGLNATGLSLNVLPVGSGNALFATGSFNVADGWQSQNVAAWEPCALRAAPRCTVDFNGDDFVDFFDYDDYVNCFETGVCPAGRTADFNGDDFVDFFDYDTFVEAFERGC